MSLHPEWVRYAGVYQAFSLEDQYDHQPRALPWAKLSDPCGVKTGMRSRSRCARPRPTAPTLYTRAPVAIIVRHRHRSALMRTFVYTNTKSRKFWSIEVTGTYYT